MDRTIGRLVFCSSHSLIQILLLPFVFFFFFLLLAEPFLLGENSTCRIMNLMTKKVEGRRDKLIMTAFLLEM